MTTGLISSEKFENLANMYNAITKCERSIKKYIQQDLYDTERLNFMANSDSTKTFITIIVIFPKSSDTFKKNKLAIRALGNYYYEKVGEINNHMNERELKVFNSNDVRVNSRFSIDGQEFPHGLLDMKADDGRETSSVDSNGEPEAKKLKK